MSLSFCLTLFSPTFPYIPYKVPWHYLKFLLAFFQIPFCSSLYSYPFLSPALCNKKHSASHTLTMLLPAELQPCSSLAAVREKATCFGLCRTSARGNDWPGQGLVPVPRLAAAALRDHWLLPFPLSSDGLSPLCLGSAFHNALGNVIIFETISSRQIWLK